MSRAKRHHHVPESYLRQFADERGNVMVYDRTRGLPPRLTSISNVAVKTNLYTVHDSNGEPSDLIESQWLSPIEDAFAEVVPRLLSATPVVTGEERQRVSLFLALQHMRTLQFRNFLSDLTDALLRLEIAGRTQGLTPEAIPGVLDAWNPHASERERTRLLTIARDPQQRATWDAEPWIKAIMRHLPAMTQRLQSRAWLLVDAVSGSFLSGDRPVILGGPYPLAIDSAPCVFFPLSSHRLLILREPGSARVWRFGRDRSHKRSHHFRRAVRQHRLVEAEAHEGFVNDVNQLVADLAAREIFWHPDTSPQKGIALPRGTHQRTVNGEPVPDDSDFYGAILNRIETSNGDQQSPFVFDLGARVTRTAVREVDDRA
jgi:hypothetical protein